MFITEPCGCIALTDHDINISGGQKRESGFHQNHRTLMGLHCSTHGNPVNIHTTEVVKMFTLFQTKVLEQVLSTREFLLFATGECVQPTPPDGMLQVLWNCFQKILGKCLDGPSVYHCQWSHLVNSSSCAKAIWCDLGKAFFFPTKTIFLSLVILLF